MTRSEKILWVLHQRGPMSRKELGDAVWSQYGEMPAITASCLSHLIMIDEIEVDANGIVKLVPKKEQHSHDR